MKCENTLPPKDDQNPTAGQGATAAFIDKGREIDIHDWRNRDCVLAALQLSAQKWGHFKVKGNTEYKALCVQLAAEHGFKISNPELQAGIENERQRIQQERVQAGQKKPVSQSKRETRLVR